MERKSFVFYESWMEAIKNLPREIQGEVLTAIVEYGLYGKTTEPLKPIAKAMLTMVIPQIDSNNTRYENGKQGGRPKKEVRPQQKPANNQDETKKEPSQYQNKTIEKPSQNQEETKVQPNVICNNDKCNNDNDIKKESANADKKEGEPEGSTPPSDYAKFQDWMKRKAKFCNDTKNFPQQITEDELNKLKAQYTGEQIASIIEQIENRRDLRKRYTNLYRTVLNWAKKEYDK